MFRSLVIGFLILSALTSNGVRLQINQQFIELSPDILLKLFNASILNGDKQDEGLSTSSGQDGIFCVASMSCGALEKQQRKIRQYGPDVWFIGSYCSDCGSFLCTGVSQRHERLYRAEIFACGTDPSPPGTV